MFCLSALLPLKSRKTCSPVRIKKKERKKITLPISDWALGPLRVLGKEAGLERRACKSHMSQRLRGRVTWWLARGNGGFRRERGFWRRRQHGGGVYDLLQWGEPRGMSGSTGATLPGSPLAAGESSGHPGLDRWAAPPAWPSGRRGAGGVCAVSPWQLLGTPVSNDLGAGDWSLRVDGESAQRSTTWRAQSSPTPRSWGWLGAGRSWPSWEAT